ncbi:MAG: hypothetical protein PHR06_03430, partial [Candidatus Cloacimonetes bacterium]|nr:hypothetical protein [Candidatus Cloacimonadota bacterium]
AYNPRESGVADDYTTFNSVDQIATASIRKQRRGVDDDGDGWIDEDPVGYAFPFRTADELPEEFSSYGSDFLYISELNGTNVQRIIDNYDIWFPLGFVNLGDTSNDSYNFTEPQNDDDDGEIDEDGYPISEQDFISYYYDYSPFRDDPDRDYGDSSDRTDHYPLKVRVRQMSYQWSYEYIKNLVYVEFNITNMNSVDTLYDCAMGIYMDSDVGPQAWGSEKAGDDASGYVSGEGYEFAYTYDVDFDKGLTAGYVGSRVCTPSPELLEFDCWNWKVGEGPNDEDPRNLNPTNKTANEKYWLLTGRNPNDTIYNTLRGNFDSIPVIEPFDEEDVYPTGRDTRYLFAFYGAQPGTPEYDEAENGIYYKRWNLPPGKTMKIVIAVFPGDTIEELKRSASWAKEIYGEAQTLTTVVIPDTFSHYNPPEPPEIPKMFAKLDEKGDNIDVYWDNRSEYTSDIITVSKSQIGWQNVNSTLDSYFYNFDQYNNSDFLPEFEHLTPDNYPANENALVNPFTAYRLRHDFQGYSVWGRSGSGSQEYWNLKFKWDKYDTEKDMEDYVVGMNAAHEFIDFGGDLGNNTWEQLSNVENDPLFYRRATEEDANYYHLDDYYRLVQYNIGDPVFGKHIYSYEKEYSEQLVNDLAGWTDEAIALYFKNPDIRDDVYLGLYDRAFIPFPGFGLPKKENEQTPNTVDEETIQSLRVRRLSSRYYYSEINNPPKGIEYYIAVTASDRGMPSKTLQALESGRDADANMKVIFPGPQGGNNMDNIYVVPNPYKGISKFDGRKEKDIKGDKSRRIWFVGIPERAKIKIYTLAGDLVDEIDHNGETEVEVLTVSKAAKFGVSASGIASWDLLSKHNQIVVSGIYLYSVENKDTGDNKVGKFVIIR